MPAPSVGLQVKAFASAAEFLQIEPPDGPACLVLDMLLPGVNGLDFQSGLARAGVEIPMVFMTGHGDIRMTVRVTAGLMNKQIAGKLGVSEITIKVHRVNLMRKMAAKSLAELLRMADALGGAARSPDAGTTMQVQLYVSIIPMLKGMQLYVSIVTCPKAILKTCPNVHWRFSSSRTKSRGCKDFRIVKSSRDIHY